MSKLHPIEWRRQIRAENETLRQRVQELEGALQQAVSALMSDAQLEQSEGRCGTALSAYEKGLDVLGRKPAAGERKG